MNIFPRGAALLSALIAVLHTGCGDDPFRVANTDFSAEETDTLEIPVTGQGTFLLLGINGNVTVEGVPDATVISVEARKVVQSESVQDAEANLDRLRVEREETADQITVQTEQPDSDETGGRDFIVFYTITVPDDMDALVGNVNGSIEVSRIRAAVAAQNINGPVTLIDIVGETAVAVVNGQVQASVTLETGENIDIGVTNGSISLSIPTDTNADLFAIVSVGNIVVNNLTVHEEVRTLNTLEGRLGEGGGLINLGTGNGVITLTGVSP